MRPDRDPAPVARARAVADAIQQADDEHIQCRTCSHPAAEDKPHCTHCDHYWNHDAGEF